MIPSITIINGDLFLRVLRAQILDYPRSLLAPTNHRQGLSLGSARAPLAMPRFHSTLNPLLDRGRTNSPP